MELLSEFPSFSGRIIKVSMCLNKDLIAVLLSGSLVVYRANGSIVSSKAFKDKIIDFKFEPNGKFLSVSFSDSIMMLHVETCSVVFEYHGAASHMNWNNNKNIKCAVQIDKILPRLIPLRKLSFNLLQHVSNDDMNILITADGCDWKLRVNGLWELGDFIL